VRFLLDVPLPPTLASWLIEQGHDAVHAGEIGMAHSSDAEILARAASESRIVVTAGLDYPRLLSLYQSDEPSLVLFRGGAWTEAEVRERLAHLFSLLGEADFTHVLYVITKTSIRRRTLPIHPPT